MLDKAKELNGYKLHSRDGDIGKVKDFYFDDQFWTIRYLIADTGSWLTGRQVLISPYALTAVHRAQRNIAVNLTKAQIEGSPSLDSDKPVSRQFEISITGIMAGQAIVADRTVGDRIHTSDMTVNNRATRLIKAGNNLIIICGTRQVTGYHIKASDGEIGHVEDFIIDDKTWAIRYLIVDTQNWLPGKRVLISPQWIQNVSWHESSVSVNVPRETIKQSPEYINESSLTRDYETRLHRHYNREGYWVNEPAAGLTLV